MFEKGKQPSPARQRQLDRYARLVDSLSPKSKMGQGLIRAFWVGGAICVIGQCPPPPHRRSPAWCSCF